MTLCHEEEGGVGQDKEYVVIVCVCSCWSLLVPPRASWFPIPVTDAILRFHPKKKRQSEEGADGISGTALTEARNPQPGPTGLT